MIKKTATLTKETKVHDSKLDRVLVLETRINPQGDVPAYWVVRNLKSDKKTTIRENRIVGRRWTKVPE